MTDAATTDLWFEDLLLAEGWASQIRLTLRDGRIAAITTGAAIAPGDERHAVGLPGLHNVHSHAFQRGMAGLAETRGPAEDNFWTWREVMYRFLDRLGPDDVEAIAALAYMEMLESGFTRVGEFHYLHHDVDGRPYANPGELAERIAAAANQTGIGLTLLPVLYAHGGLGGLPPAPGQRRFLSSIDGSAALVAAAERASAALADANVGVAPHSLRAVTPEMLDQVVALAPHGPIHIHAAEQVREVEDCVAWSGRRPVEWLLDRGLDSRWCLIHATHLTQQETLGLARSGAVAGLCPITEANLGDGVFPAAAYLAAGGAIAIGTDSNILIDAAGELRALEYAQRLSARARNVLADAEGASVGAGLFRAAVAGGAQALARPLAGLRVGAPADIVSLDPDHPSLVARRRDSALDGWVFAAGGTAVEAVWRHGVRVVKDGRHRDRDAIGARYRRVLSRLLAG
jgi:formimidoylglutamate deiminase